MGERGLTTALWAIGMKIVSFTVCDCIGECISWFKRVQEGIYEVLCIVRAIEVFAIPVAMKFSASYSIWTTWLSKIYAGNVIAVHIPLLDCFWSVKRIVTSARCAAKGILLLVAETAAAESPMRHFLDGFVQFFLVDIDRMGQCSGFDSMSRISIVLFSREQIKSSRAIASSDP